MVQTVVNCVVKPVGVWCFVWLKGALKMRQVFELFFLGECDGTIESSLHTRLIGCNLIRPGDGDA